MNIASCVNRKTLRECAGAEVITLNQAHETIDMIFEKYGPRAVAVKDQCAYSRRLDFPEVSDEEAAPLFYVSQRKGSGAGRDKAIQDNRSATVSAAHLNTDCL